MLKLDLGCGNNKQKDFTGIDIVKEGTQADIEADILKFPWSFAKHNSVDEIYCSHFIEHIPHGNGFDDPFFEFFNEVWRILKPEGKATFITPYYTSIRAWQDPSHNRVINEATYAYFNADWRRENKLEHYPIKADLKVAAYNYLYDEQAKEISKEDLEFAMKHFWNIGADMRVVLQK